MIKDNVLDKLLKMLFFLILVILINGRSLIGLYIFGFRIGEYITGFSILLFIFIAYKYKYFVNEFNYGLVNSYFLLVFYFFVLNLLKSGSFLNLRVYKTSVFIWYISILFIGYIIFKSINISDYFLIFGYIGLLLQYIFNVLFYPEAFTNFFNSFSDKTQFLKGSEIAIFFMTVTFFSNSIKKEGRFIDCFVIFSSIYLPLTIFKSRSAGIAIIIYFFIEIYKYRSYFKKYLKKTIALIILFLLLFSVSSFYLIDNPPTIENADEAIAQVFKHKYVVANTWDGDVPVFYVFEGRLYSADGNLNWRLQLWQDVLIDSYEKGNITFGLGFSEKVKVFENLIYSGLDGLNENTHNYLLNIYVRGGLVAVILVIYFFYQLLKISKQNFSNNEFLVFLIPLTFISMFDGSMENPYFACVFYFFVSSFFSGIKFVEEEVT